MKIQIRVALSVFLLLLMDLAAWAQNFPQPPQVSPREFALMAWGTSPSNSHQLDLMRQAGLNISGFCTLDELKQVNDAGMTCFVTDPRANGYKWTQMPDKKELQKKIDPLVKEVGNHPAALGFFLHDEPQSRMMPGLGEVARVLRHAMPSVWSYVNLLPNYATSQQLGTPTYEAYVKKFIDEVHPPLLSYDNYSLFNGEMLDRFYTNLGTVRRLSMEAGIPFWNVILANSHFSYMEPSSATLRLQAYTTMAYGGRGIEYFTYYAPMIGNFRLAPVDQFGHRTATWDKLRRLNNQIRELAPWLSRLRSTGVYHSAPVPKGARPIAQTPLIKDVHVSTYHSPPVQPEYLIGEFRDTEGHRFLMIVNKSLKYSFHYVIDLKKEKEHLVQISPYTGQYIPFGGEVNWLAPGAGALLEIK